MAQSQPKEDVPSLIRSIYKGTDSGEAMSRLLELNSAESDQLIAYTSELTRLVNDRLTDDPMDFEMLNLALELSMTELVVLNKSASDAVVKAHQEIRADLKQAKDYHEWIWDDNDYLVKRTLSGLMLDLLGYDNQSNSIEELRSSNAHFEDQRLRMFASLSLVRRQQEVSAQSLKAIASDDESRQFLFNGLKQLDKLELYPADFISQEELSKSDMINWLLYPTELARIPSAIEFIQMFTIEFDDVGPADFYLWKFRSDHESWSSQGWMVGLSGPFVRAETPTTEHYGFTFSAFTKLDEKTPDEHFDEIVDIMIRWQEENSRQ